jgi:hypothetical protein
MPTLTIPGGATVYFRGRKLKGEIPEAIAAQLPDNFKESLKSKPKPKGRRSGGGQPATGSDGD